MIVVGIIFTALSVVLIFNPSTWSYGETPEQERLKNKAEELYKDYERCNSQLEEQWSLVDTTDQLAVDDYNADYDKCEAVRLEQNKTVDEYDASLNSF